MNYANRTATLDALRRATQNADTFLANEIYAENADMERQRFSTRATIEVTRPAMYTGQKEPNEVTVTLALTSTVPHIKEEGAE